MSSARIACSSTQAKTQTTLLVCVFFSVELPSQNMARLNVAISQDMAKWYQSTNSEPY